MNFAHINLIYLFVSDYMDIFSKITVVTDFYQRKRRNQHVKIFYEEKNINKL